MQHEASVSQLSCWFPECKILVQLICVMVQPKPDIVTLQSVRCKVASTTAIYALLNMEFWNLQQIKTGPSVPTGGGFICFSQQTLQCF